MGVWEGWGEGLIEGVVAGVEKVVAEGNGGIGESFGEEDISGIAELATDGL